MEGVWIVRVLVLALPISVPRGGGRRRAQTEVVQQKSFVAGKEFCGLESVGGFETAWGERHTMLFQK